MPWKEVRRSSRNRKSSPTSATNWSWKRLSRVCNRVNDFRRENTMDKKFEEPTIESYDRDELAPETAFTGGFSR
jgi:hypothetical protein